MAIVGIGTEIVECVRIAKMMETHGEQFLVRVYGADEIAYCMKKANSTQQFATRWAAKEAAIKAMRCHHQGVRWTEVQVVVQPGEGPSLALVGRAERWAERQGIEKLHVSLGASRTHATAFVTAVDSDG